MTLSQLVDSSRRGRQHASRRVTQRVHMVTALKSLLFYQM